MFMTLHLPVSDIKHQRSVEFNPQTTNNYIENNKMGFGVLIIRVKWVIRGKGIWSYGLFGVMAFGIIS